MRGGSAIGGSLRWNDPDRFHGYDLSRSGAAPHAVDNHDGHSRARAQAHWRGVPMPEARSLDGNSLEFSCAYLGFFASRSNSTRWRSRASICLSGIIVGPSDGALSGLSCVSMKTPATPTATAARASTGTNSRSPPEEVPCPPGCCTEWVASKIIGARVARLRIGSARMSDTSVL